MDTIRYVTDSKGNNSGLLIDFSSAKKTIKSKAGLIALFEDIEDILLVEFTQKEKSFSYKKARKHLFGKRK
jgi:hypothetical protein